ncbi:citrate synthase/methylcitrate synthase [Cytobacillus solani]|uniref:citrate synthase/methylcitrate synthase n=1 Tax=Cytobacillus solani TaxID=1637975 RepID=UPI0006ABE118|nr:citrate synthase/methylcitrate synthase [Cytobacillus solani]KOP71191.1 citrate synthase [Bacillus sp. FJAT-21945]USK55683.1 citrate synthase/methylcitrate synthase [Cytobacillus solani]
MIHYGLKGVIAAETKISHVDGEKGQLIYRGYEIGEITKTNSFEETAYLLWNGEFPTDRQLIELKASLINNRELPSYMIDLICSLPDEMDMMSVLRTVISSEGRRNYGWKPTIDQAIRITSMAPAIIAYRKRHLEGKTFIPPKPELNHVENYLYMLNGEVPLKAHVNALETYMILTMEHGMNASTFSARVTASTESDLVSAITSAIGTMKGPLHGGAPSEVITLLNEVHEQGDAEMVIRNKLNRGEKLMGFGHRIYKTVDPRSAALKSKLLTFSGEDEWLDLSMKVEKLGVQILGEVKPGRSLYTNVEFYAAAIMKAVQMEKELFTPTFTASRIVGWSAHILEQAENNVIFRPQSKYIGPVKKKEELI